MMDLIPNDIDHGCHDSRANMVERLYILLTYFPIFLFFF